MAQAWEASLRLLAYRARSEAEIRRRLTARFNAETIEQTVTSLHARGYLDDATFARDWRDSRERRRPKGEALIRQELLGLGVAADVVREALKDYDAYSNAYHAGRKLAQRLPAHDYPEFRKRLWAHLQRRGFHAGVITETVHRLWGELTELLHGEVDPRGEE